MPLPPNVPAPKKPGKWCAMHVRIAWEIYNHAQHHQHNQSQPNPEALKLGDFSSLTGPTGKEFPLMGKGPSLAPASLSLPMAGSLSSGKQLNIHLNDKFCP